MGRELACLRAGVLLPKPELPKPAGGRQELAASGGRAGGEELAWERQPILHAPASVNFEHLPEREVSGYCEQLDLILRGARRRQLWGNNKAWRSQARIPEPGQPSCLHRTPPGERWRDGPGETEARSGAGLPASRVMPTGNAGLGPCVSARTHRPSSSRGTAFAQSRAPVPAHGSIFRATIARCSLAMLVGTAVRVRHLPPAGCFP